MPTLTIPEPPEAEFLEWLAEENPCFWDLEEQLDHAERSGASHIDKLRIRVCLRRLERAHRQAWLDSLNAWPVAPALTAAWPRYPETIHDDPRHYE